MRAVAPDLQASLEEGFLPFIETVPDAMILSDGNGRIVLANTNAEKLFGFRRSELLGQKVEVLIPVPLRARHRKDRTRYYSDPEVRMMGMGRELTGCRQDGSELRVEITLSPLEIGGQSFVWSAIRDVTEREALTHQMRAALHQHGFHGGLISICAWCKRVRDERGSWQALEQYVESHSAMKFTHGLCGECLRRLNHPSPSRDA
jgi:PAS domain S-box-containing protein